MRKNIVILILIALLVIVSAAYAASFQIDCEPFVSTLMSGGSSEDWRLSVQKVVLRNGERYLKCMYNPHETHHAAAAAADLTGWRGAN